MNWQPIETAPKDGTLILILHHGQVYAGVWGKGVKVEDGYSWGVIDKWGDYNAMMDTAPTHWMPLPETPEQTGAKT